MAVVFSEGRMTARGRHYWGVCCPTCKILYRVLLGSLGMTAWFPFSHYTRETDASFQEVNFIETKKDVIAYSVS